ncbi:MAG TPA: UDP-2,3-diacylglucosamine diphosphatase [Steroidobacteraceae bacterium]|nr:UDP-2,3-diacylglucosamine diphosphatase [Steroidobacteraceae bacterium]
MSADRILFVSDLHLDEESPRAVAQFTDFLRGEARDAQALYILGDLFETWIGDDDDEPVRQSVCAALREFTRQVPCHVIRGNRDFLLGAGFERRSGCQLLPDPVRLQSGDLRLLLSHGDLLCTRDVRYQRFREFARGAGARRGYLSLPLRVRRMLASRARADSAAYTRAAAGSIMDVDPDTVATLFGIGDADLLVHGHTHRPAVHCLRVAGRERTRIVLGDWHQGGSCLAIAADGRYETLRLPTRAGSTLSMASSSARV